MIAPADIPLEDEIAEEAIAVDDVQPIEESVPEPPTFKELVEATKPRLLELYASSPPGDISPVSILGENYTPKEFSIFAVAWHRLYDEKLVPMYFYKPKPVAAPRG